MRYTCDIVANGLRNLRYEAMKAVDKRKIEFYTIFAPAIPNR